MPSGRATTSGGCRLQRWSVFALLLALLNLSGCAMRGQENWHDVSPDRPTPVSINLAEQARQNFNQALDAQGLRAAIATYEQVLTVNPGDSQALTALSTQHILLGTAYTSGRHAKSRHFLIAMDYAERAMYSNQAFRAEVATGTPLWDAVDLLEDDQLEAMFFWVKALHYQFKEGLTLVGKIVNIRWMEHSLKVLERIVEIDPEFGGGGVEFAMAISYEVLPSRWGGSSERADAYMQQAVEAHPDWLLPRWARGRYYYEIRGEPEKSQADLAWVASRNPRDYADPTAWKRFFQADAGSSLH
ncbi:MAG TPA: TRAP transporter TatT component family protein [Pelovirga sp.]|nr:TRAP transporter TatT component family protein [Pelovirga sp.]